MPARTASIRFAVELAGSLERSNFETRMAAIEAPPKNARSMRRQSRARKERAQAELPRPHSDELAYHLTPQWPFEQSSYQATDATKRSLRYRATVDAMMLTC